MQTGCEKETEIFAKKTKFYQISKIRFKTEDFAQGKYKKQMFHNLDLDLD